MRVAIDARELCGRPTGVGRYLSGLLDAWAASRDARRHEWTLIAPEPIAGVERWEADTLVVNGGGGTWWEQSALPKALRTVRPGVFFAPGYTAPLTVAAPLVLTIHDVSFFAHPEWFSFREGLRRRWLTAWSARRARAVITDSQFSRHEIQKFIGLSPSRVRSIPLGITAGTAGEYAKDGAMVLFVGSILARRRVDRLIAAFDDVIDRVPSATLQIVGDNRTPGLDLEAVRHRSAHPDRITLRSYVDEATLTDLYRRATVFAFLSEYEGFGFTPLEAMTHGAVPVVLDTDIARETYDDAARYVSSEASNDDIAAAIAGLLARQDERSAMVKKAAAVVRRYDWTRTAAQTLEVLEEAAIGR